MARYFFHVEDGHHARDTEGTELPDIRAARAEAVATMGAMMIDAADGFFETGDLKMTVQDERGLTLFTLEVTSTGAPAVSALQREACQRASGTGWR